METHSTIKGHIAALFTVTVWGITFISIKVLLSTFTAVEVMFFRLVFAVLALLAISPPRIRPGRLDLSWLLEEAKTMAAGLFGVTLYYLFQNAALSYTLAANVSVLVSVSPLFTALVSLAALKEKLRANFFLGFFAAITGILLIAFNGSMVLKLNPLGDVLSILAALSWAFYSVTIKKTGTAPGDVLVVTRKLFLYGLLFMLPALPFSGFHLGLERLASLPNLLNLLFLGAVASAVCYITWNYAVHALGPVKTSVYIYAIPLVTIAASALILRETITPVAGAGMALILAGMAISEQKRRSEKLPDPAANRP